MILFYLSRASFETWWPIRGMGQNNNKFQLSKCYWQGQKKTLGLNITIAVFSPGLYNIMENGTPKLQMLA